MLTEIQTTCIMLLYYLVTLGMADEHLIVDLHHLSPGLDQSSSRLVENEGNVIMVVYGKCECGLTPGISYHIVVFCDGN